MKKIVLYLACGLCLFATSSCNDFLKEESKSEMTLEYYNTDEGLRLGVDAIYSQLRANYRESFYKIHFFSDITELGASTRSAIDDYIDDVSSSYFNSVFNGIQQGVAKANRMEKIIGDPDTAIKEQYLGEIRCFRAWFYADQAEFFGKYGNYQEHVYDQYEDSMLEVNQKPLDFMYKKVLEDINYAIDHLPTKSQNADFGRLTQGMAKALKARILLNIAGYSNKEYSGAEEYNLYSKLGYTSESQLYTEARQLAKSVINDYGYKLEKNFGDVFEETNQLNDEVIFSVQYTQETKFNTNDSRVHEYGCSRNGYSLTMKKNSDGSTSVSEGLQTVWRPNDAGTLVKYTPVTHSMYYGREYRHVLPSYKWISMFSDNDKRKKETFETTFIKIDDGLLPPADLADTVVLTVLRPITLEEDQQYSNWVASKDPKAYYLDGLNEIYDLDDPSDTRHYGGPLSHRSRYTNLKKFYDRSRIATAKQDAGTGNVILVRLAEMYLIDAECACKLGLGDQAVYDAIAPLWQRAFDNVADANVYKPAKADIDFVIDEYERELGNEFNSFFILKRNRKLIDRMKDMPISKEEEKSGQLGFGDYVQKYGDILYLKPFPATQALTLGMTRDQLTPGYPYGSNFK